MFSIPQIIRIILATVYLILIVLTIPLAFDVGGINCGLAYALFVASLYFVLTTLRVLVRNNKNLRILSIFYYLQHLFLPSLLTLFLSIFQNDFFNNNVINLSLGKYLFEPWKLFIVNSTPLFTILEGFCSLLLIQAIGQTTRWLTKNRSDTWLILSLMASGAIITGGSYFLYKIYVYPITISIVSASLLGSILTYTAGLGLYGIVSGKGSTIESSLIFVYVVRCIYETFPELSNEATLALTSLIAQTTNNLKNEIPYLPQQLTEPFSTTLAFLASNLPGSFQTVWEFLIVASKTLTLPLLLNLAYRIGVFYAATKIIPSLQPQPPSTKAIRLLYAYSPCLVIAVYTHLMMQYNGELGTELKIWGWWTLNEAEWVIVHPWPFWNWINMVTTLFLYTVELISEPDNTLTSHWKVE